MKTYIRENICIRETKHKQQGSKFNHIYKTAIKMYSNPINIQHGVDIVQWLSHLTLQPHELQHVRLPCPSLSPGVCSKSCPLSQWRHLILHRPLLLLSVSWPFAWRDQSTEASASAPMPPVNIQSWFPLGLTSLISFLFKGPSKVFSNTTVRKQQFFGTQPSLYSNSHIHTWLLEKP